MKNLSRSRRFLKTARGLGPVVDLESLPEDRAALRNIVAQLSGWNERLLAEVFRLRRRAYGPKSERLPDGQTILDGYGRVVEEAPPPEPEKQAPPPEGAKKRKGHGRRVVDPDLPRQGILHDLSEDEKNCGRCGKRMRAFDDEVSECQATPILTRLSDAISYEAGTRIPKERLPKYNPAGPRGG